MFHTHALLGYRLGACRTVQPHQLRQMRELSAHRGTAIKPPRNNSVFNMALNPTLDKGAVLSVCHSTDGRLLASAGQGGTVQILDVASGQTVHELVGFGESISSVCFASSGRILAAAERRDASIKIWDLARGVEIRCLHAQYFGGVNSVSISCDDGLLVAGYGNVVPDHDLSASDSAGSTKQNSNAVMMWDMATGMLKRQIVDGHRGAVTTVACSPVSVGCAASGSIDGTVKVWFVMSGMEKCAMVKHTAAVWSVCFSPDGNKLASASSDKTVRLWNASTGDCYFFINGHSKIVTSVQITNDNRKILSCSSDRTVRLWNLTNGAELACAEGDGAFTAVSVGTHFNVAVGCASGELYLLDMSKVSSSSTNADRTQNERPLHPELPSGTIDEKNDMLRMKMNELRKQLEDEAENVRRQKDRSSQQANSPIKSKHDRDKELEDLKAQMDANWLIAVSKLKLESEQAISALKHEAATAVEKMKAEVEADTKIAVERIKDDVFLEKERAVSVALQMAAKEREEALVAAQNQVQLEKENAVQILVHEKNLTLQNATKEAHKSRDIELARLMENLERELGAAVEAMKAEHKERMHATLSKIEADCQSETEKAVAEVRSGHSQSLMEEVSKAKDECASELRVLVERECDHLKASHVEELEEAKAKAREEHVKRLAIEIDAAIEGWRQEGQEQLRNRLEEYNEEQKGRGVPAIADLEEVFGSSAARQISYTMQLVRDWATTDDDQKVKTLYDESMDEQQKALKGIRELYVSQLQRFAEALLTRTPSPPDELIEIVEQTTQMLMGHKSSVPKMEDDDRLQRILTLETMDAASWIHEIAKKEIEGPFVDVHEVPSAAVRDKLHHSKGARSSENFHANSNHLEDMIRALRNTPNRQLANVVGEVRRELASDMADVFMDGPENFHHELTRRSPSRAHSRHSMEDGDMLHGGLNGHDFGEADGWDVSGGRQNLRMYKTLDPRHLARSPPSVKQLDDMRKQLTERFRYLEPSPTKKTGPRNSNDSYAYWDAMSDATSPMNSARTHEHDRYGAIPLDNLTPQSKRGFTEPRVQIPFWMRHHRQVQVQKESMRRAAAHIKRQKKVMAAMEDRGENMDLEHVAVLKRLSNSAPAAKNLDRDLLAQPNSNRERLVHMRDDLKKTRSTQHGGTGVTVGTPLKSTAVNEHTHLHTQDIHNALSVTISRKSLAASTSRMC